MYLLLLFPIFSLPAAALLSSSFCSSGRFQSPINIIDTQFRPSDIRLVTAANSSYVPLRLEYPECDGEYNSRQTEFTYELSNLKGGFRAMEVEGKEVTQFNLERIEFHAPAEHHLNGGAYSLEMQLIHSSASGSTSILSVRYTRGDEYSPLLEAVISDSPISLAKELGRSIEEFYFYSGSVTTPPCGEGVSWFVLLGNRAPLIASERQIRYFTSMWGERGHARTVRHINDRPVFHFLPTVEAPTFLA